MKCKYRGKEYYVRSIFPKVGYAIICEKKELNGGFKVELKNITILN